MNFRRIITLLSAVAVLASCAQSNIPVITVEGGQVKGVRSETRGVTVYKGIPYAAPPVDTLRWSLPQMVEPWEGVLVADTFGKIPYQMDMTTMDLYGKEFYSAGMPEMSEDCLYLNVWTPSEAVADTTAKLPVAVWIHGGAFSHGYGHEITFDGDAWAKKGVILVTINYRLGVLGFLASSLFLDPEKMVATSGNYGLYDQAFAIGWVYRNIQQFGGDPSNITIFGQSAGAKSVQSLVSSTVTGEFVSKAIIQSGGGINTNEQKPIMLYQAIEQGDAFCEKMGYETVEQIRAASPEEIMAKADEYKANGGELTLRPILDFALAGSSFTSAAAMDRVLDIPYMIGFVSKDRAGAGDDIDQFCASRDYYEGQPVYEYEFTRELPGDDAGAFHSAELWYMFHTLDRCWRPFTKADYKLADEMLDAWTNFAKYGDPNGAEPSDAWPPFTQENSFRKIFDIEN